MDTNFENNQVTITIDGDTYSTGFIKRAIEFARTNGLYDTRSEKSGPEVSMAVHTPVGAITSRPMAETNSYLGFWTDWLADGEFIALSTSEYQAEEKAFVTHEYANFGEDSPTKSITHYFYDKNMTDAESVLLLLRKEGTIT